MACDLIGLIGLAAASDVAPVVPTTRHTRTARTECQNDVEPIVIALLESGDVSGGTPRGRDAAHRHRSEVQLDAHPDVPRLPVEPLAAEERAVAGIERPALPGWRIDAVAAADARRAPLPRSTVGLGAPTCAADG